MSAGIYFGETGVRTRYVEHTILFSYIAPL